jgi:UDP-glucose 4-epimerase
MRVMVTGASGWIGGYVLDELTRRGHEAIGTSDRPSTTHPVAFVSVTDAGRVHSFVAEHEPEVIINLAGRLGTHELLGHEADAAQANILGAINVYDAAFTRNIRVVQIGTGHKGQPNTYAITKGAAEDLGLARAAHLGQPITIVRAFHAYGPGQAIPPPHGQAHVRKIVPSMLCRALTGMPIEIFGDGKNLIDLVHVSDVATTLVDAAMTGLPGETIEAGNGVDLSVSDVAEDIIAATRSESRIVYLPARPGEPVGARAVADRPYCHQPWPFGLAETIGWYGRAIGLRP